MMVNAAQAQEIAPQWSPPAEDRKHYSRPQSASPQYWPQWSRSLGTGSTTRPSAHRRCPRSDRDGAQVLEDREFVDLGAIRSAIDLPQWSRSLRAGSADALNGIAGDQA